VTPERWERVKALFDSALRRPTGERHVFLGEACAGDANLRREVESLLASYERAGTFIDEPIAPPPVAPSAAPALTPGSRVGPYEVVGLVGAGGMGEVYRVRDPRLHREVALKILPSWAVRDPEQLRRFEQEARAAGALNHPNILAVFDVGRHQGGPFVVSELLEGETLRERQGAGPLPLRKAVDCAIQIARGLAAAHEKGIVHRDLKPENVFVTKEGHVKILDFGLAKLTPGLADAKTVDLVPATEPGMVLGTAGYMSPEQVRGLPADQRADIFSFGAVLYEMLAGRRAFPGDSAAEAMTAILNENPSELSQLNPAVPPALALVVHHCLEKDPLARFQSVRDLAFHLESLSQPSGPRIPPEPELRIFPRRPPLLAVVALGTLAVAAAAFLAGRRWATAPTAAEAVRVNRLTDFEGLEESPALSPDGRSVAFAAHRGGWRHIWVRLLAGGAPLQITHDAADHAHPRWSADSSTVIYYSPPAEGGSHGSVFEIPALGGAPRRIASSLGGADVSHEGTRIAFLRFEDGRFELAISARDGSAAKAVARFEPGCHYSFAPRWSPSDGLIAFQRACGFKNELFVVSAEGGPPQRVVEDGNLLRGFAWIADGSGLLFSSARGATTFYLPTYNLWTASLAGGSPRQLTFGEVSYVEPDVGRAREPVASRLRMQFDIWRIPVDGRPGDNVRRAVRVTHQTGQVQTPSTSPDDREMVYLSDSGGHGNLWVMDLGTGESRPMTDEQDPSVVMGVPIWSPDGRYIAFFSNKASQGSGGYWLLSPDGSGLRNLVPEGGWAAWSSDGRWLYYTQSLRRLSKVPVEGGEAVTVRSELATGPAPGPDGALFFVVEMPRVTGRPDYELRVARPEDGPSRLLVRIPASRVPIWQWQLLHPVLSPDGRWLALPLTDGVTTNVWAVSTTDGSLRPITDFGERATFIARRVCWSRDGRFVFAAVGEGDADVVGFRGLKP